MSKHLLGLPVDACRPYKDIEFTLEQAMKAKRGSTLSLTSALDGGGWLTPRPGRFIVGKENL